MSSEEKQELPPKEEKVTEKKVVDYSKKNFYDYLGLKSDASEETIKAAYEELSKKYNPITNPDEIGRYQYIRRSGEILTNKTLKKFYDDFGELSVLFYEVFQHFFPFIVEEKPNNYLNACFFGVFGGCVCVFLLVLISINHFINYNNSNWYVIFIPGYILLSGYLLFIYYKYKRDLAHVDDEVDQEIKENEGKKGKKDNKKNAKVSKNRKVVRKKEISIDNGFSVCKTLLLLLTLVLVAYRLSKGKEGTYYIAFIPYFEYEALSLFKKFNYYKMGLYSIMNKKESESLLLRDNVLLKYLTGRVNEKANSDGKVTNSGKGFTTTAKVTFFIHIFKVNIYRLLQCFLLIKALGSSPSRYIFYFIPTILIFIFSNDERILHRKIGYIRGPSENVLSLLKLFGFFMLNVDLLFVYASLDYNAIPLTSASFPFLIGVAVLGGILVGVFPFIPIMEFKMKHDEFDVPY